MKTFFTVITIVNLTVLSAHIVRYRDLCPIVCRVDANGIRSAWYETQINGFRTAFWVSPEQVKLAGGRP